MLLARSQMSLVLLIMGILKSTDLPLHHLEIPVETEIAELSSLKLKIDRGCQSRNCMFYIVMNNCKLHIKLPPGSGRRNDSRHLSD